MKKNLLLILASMLAVSVSAQVEPSVGPGAAPPMPAPAPVPAASVGPGAAEAPMPQPNAPTVGPGAAPMPPPQPAQPLNQNGSTQLLFRDEMGQPKTARVNPPMLPPPGAAVPPVTVQWTIFNGNGTIAGNMFDGFRYQGDNGAGYETRIVVMPTNDPNRPYEARFQSKRMGTQEYRDGRVIILDWQNNPWIVKVKYANERGLFFEFEPYVHE